MTWALLLLRSGWSWVLASAAHILAACLALSLVWGYYEHHEAAKYRRAYDSASKALDAAEAASKAEGIRAQKEHDAAVKHEKELNDATDERVRVARADDARRLADYLGRLHKAHRSDSEKLPAPGSEAVAKGGDGSGDPAKLDETLADDLDTCTVNTRRLLELHSEALSP